MKRLKIGSYVRINRHECPTNGRLYVDVEPVADREPVICTKYMNAFDGEPDCHVKPEISFDFIPRRDTW